MMMKAYKEKQRLEREGSDMGEEDEEVLADKEKGKEENSENLNI